MRPHLADAVKVWTDTVKDPNANPFARHAAADKIVERLVGKPKDSDTAEDQPRYTVDLGVLNLKEQRQLLEFLRRGLLKRMDVDAAPPVQLEGEAIDAAAG